MHFCIACRGGNPKLGLKSFAESMNATSACLSTVRQLLLAAACLLAATGYTAETSAGKPPPATTLLAADPLAAYRQHKIQDARWTAEVVPAPGQPFREVIRARTLRRPTRPYEIQLRFRTTAAVQPGDALLVSFHARAIEAPAETGEAAATVVFERAGEPYTKWLDTPISVGRDWKQFHLPFRAGEQRGPGEAQLNYQLGFDPQVIEIGSIALANFGPQVKLTDLPATRFGYRGMEPDAPWRRGAEARIEKYRKGDLTVVVTDAAGKPLPNATVAVRMKRHEFGFGSAVAATLITDRQSENARKYREMILKLYNKVVFENDLKWPQWENQANRQHTLNAARWLNDHGLAIRGHCLVWPAWRYLPKGVEQLQSDLPALRARVNGHVTEEAGAMRGQLTEWDVINEPYTNHLLMDLLGRDVMVEWFKLARQADPQARLFINDYAILSAGGKDKTHQDHYERTIRFLLDQGAPLEGIGMQGHFGHDLTPPERLIQILDRFAALGKPIQVTEHDININDEQLQADYTRDFLTALFSHPSVSGILTWGFWEGRHWRPAGAYFRKDWSAKPAGQIWMELVLKKWWTNAEGQSGGTGEFHTRAFAGDYEITVSRAGKTKTVQASVSRAGHKVTVPLN